MIFAWLKRHAKPVITGVSAAVVVAVVAVTAIVSSGYTEQKMELNDASVWVANGSRQVVGRANTGVLELNSVVRAASLDLRVLQRGDSVLLHDVSGNTVSLIDPATSTITETVALPPQSPELSLVDDYVVIHSPLTGEVWLVRSDSVGGYDASAAPDLTLDSGSALAVDERGNLAGFDRATGQLITLNIISGGEPVAQTVSGFTVDDTDQVQITVVGGKPVLLNSTTGQLAVDGVVQDVSDVVTASDKPLLQAPAVSGDRALLAYSGGLIGIALSGGATTELESGRTGLAAAPVVNNGCSYAAWSDGTTWEQCGRGDAATATLASAAPDQELAFQQNGNYVVLNEPSAGRVWAVQRNGELINNWDQLIDDEVKKQEEQQKDEDTPPILEKDQLPPVAVDDNFGARPGRANLLPVLLNDYDSNGDVILISEFTAIPENLGYVEVINSRQQLQVTLAPDAAGSFSFGYTITDGHGNSASATVTVTVRLPSENSSPVQARITKASVAAGGTFTTDVLGDWYDPDGDPMYLESASAAEPDRVAFTPAGQVTFNDKGAEAAAKEVGLSVSDFSASGTGRIAVTVGTPGEVPIIAEGFAVLGYAGRDLTIEPLSHVRGGTGQIRLANVAEITDATITPNFNQGSFAFRTEKAGEYSLTYSLVDVTGQTGTGTIRVQITVAPDASSKPITVPTVAFLYQQQTDLVDVLSNDIDPAGGVLILEKVAQVPQATGAVVELLDHRILRVRLNSQLTEPLVFTYTVTNGLSSAEGTVTVFQVPEPKRLQAPVASPDTVSVRTGEVIDIPVLDNDVHPNRKPLTLSPDLVQNVASGGGFLFVAGNHLRYLAPEQPGNYTAIYRLETSADVQFDTAEVKITVREPDVSTNTPPAPKTVQARVVAGETVKVTIPLSGIDADGDSVRLVGASANPTKGNVTVGTDFLSYTASDVSQGTDSFAYEVVDGLGARAYGSVRVGISPRLDTASTPVAMDDIVVTRPGKTLTVRVLDNDSDPNDSPLKVVGVEPTDPSLTVSFDKDRVVFNAPPAEGDYAVIYTVQNEQGQQASAWLRVHVWADAPAIRPEAKDTVLSLTDILNKDTVDVKVLKNVYYVEGSVSELTLDVVPGFGKSATVREDGVIRVAVTDKRQIIPFTVARPDDPTVNAHAFIWVPGRADALPELRKDAPALTVVSGDTLRVNINDYVVAVDGKKVQLTDAANVKASNSNGENLVVDQTTLQFVSKEGYWGPASLSFEVTDGSSATDANGRKAVIVLPIAVKPRDNQPPVFSGAEVTLEPGNERIIDLQGLTKYPYPDDMAQLAYEINSAPASGFSASLAGTQLTVKSEPSNPVGSTSLVGVGVRDAKNVGQSGSIRLTVVTSNRPLASPNPDAITIRRGEIKPINVLDNDQAANPFPGKPLTVVSVIGNQPPGVTVTPSPDKSTLTVVVDKSVDIRNTGQIAMQYRVADATLDPNRFTTGTVTITIVDAPDQPTAPVLSGSGFVNGQLSVSAAPLPYPNGQPITSFQLRSTDGSYSHDCGAAATCVLTDLVAGKDYQFVAVAINAIGESTPSPASAPMRSDYVPAAPTGLSAAVTPANGSQSNPGQVTFSWNPIPNPSPGSPIVAVRAQVNGVDQPVSAGATSFTFQGEPGGSYTATVWAENGANTMYPGQFAWNTASSAAVVAQGLPGALTSNVAAKQIGDADQIEVSWGAPSAQNGPVMKITVQRYASGGQVSSCSTGAAPGTAQSSSYVDSGTSPGGSYVYVVFVDNGWGCSAFQSNPVTLISAPQPPVVTLGYADPDRGFYSVKVASISGSGSGPAPSYFTLSGASEVSVGSVLPGDFGTSRTWSFRACVSQDGVTRCSGETVSSSEMPVDANRTVAECTPGGSTSSLVTDPNDGISWTNQFWSKIDNGPWLPVVASTIPTGLPGQTVSIAVLTSGNGGQFVNGTSPTDVSSGNIRVCQ